MLLLFVWLLELQFYSAKDGCFAAAVASINYSAAIATAASGAETLLDIISKRSPRDGTLQLLLLLIATMPYLLPNQWQ